MSVVPVAGYAMAMVEHHSATLVAGGCRVFCYPFGGISEFQPFQIDGGSMYYCSRLGGGGADRAVRRSSSLQANGPRGGVVDSGHASSYNGTIN